MFFCLVEFDRSLLLRETHPVSIYSTKLLPAWPLDRYWHLVLFDLLYTHPPLCNPPGSKDFLQFMVSKTCLPYNRNQSCIFVNLIKSWVGYLSLIQRKRSAFLLLVYRNCLHAGQTPGLTLKSFQVLLKENLNFLSQSWARFHILCYSGTFFWQHTLFTSRSMKCSVLPCYEELVVQLNQVEKEEGGNLGNLRQGSCTLLRDRKICLVVT